ncbi:MAG TPA: peptide chain release factor N(5)-glutamine methyltransferase [Acidobacteriaceae bacterium]|nr:peptide chain release factor N(5)-glutamine methyltransferase [Acidobacteriaceae bacterium]
MFAESMTVGDAIAWGADILDESDASGPHSREDSMLLLRHVLGIQPAEMHAYRERPLTALQTEAFNALIQQRAHGTPIQHLTGEQEFFSLPFHVGPDVLIPRPETEHLVEAAIARLQHHPAPRTVDVGTGSGAIAVALAHALPHAEIVALDISPAALGVAMRNAQRNHVAHRIRFVESDLLAAVQGESFDAIVSNPPYIAFSERPTLPIEVREHEPALALFAGPTGLEFYQRLIPAAHPLLVSGGWLLMEIGHGQRDAIRALLEDQHWDSVEFIPDLQSIPRVAVARKQ